MPLRSAVSACPRVFLCGLAIAIYSALPQAQTPPAANAQTPSSLPVRRVVLYKSGVGYFEHVGQVRGNQTVTIDFTSGQLDDVLKSITALDLGGGRISSVQYNSNESLDRQLAALTLPLDGKPTRYQFLSALRGARIEVGTPNGRVAGRLLSVDTVARTSAGTTSNVETVSIVTDAGELQTVALDPGVTVRLLESGVSQEVSKYLSTMSSARQKDVRRLSIAASGTGDRDLFVSYVSEVPVWKATYRLVVPDQGDSHKPLLQGWAIVDNTVGEDWTNVQMSLVAGAPQAFVQAISRPYYVQRPVVPLPERFLLTPQTHGSAITSGTGVLTGTVTDKDRGTIPGVSVVLMRDGQPIARTVTDSRGQYRIPALAGGMYNIVVSLQGFKTFTSSVTVRDNGEAIANATLEVGPVSEAVTVTSALSSTRQNIAIDGIAPQGFLKSTDGLFTRVVPRSDAVTEVAMARRAQLSDADAAQLGDLFEYRMKEPVTIRKGQSALVPILSNEVDVEKVSLWNADSSSTRALRALWLTNNTGLTLDGGSFSIVEGQAFAGEGLMETIKAGDRRLLSYAVDLGLVLNSAEDDTPNRVTTITVANGIITKHSEDRRKRTYTARNQDAERKTLIIEHPADEDWTIVSDTKPTESTADWHRFRVTIEPKSTATLVVEETRPDETSVRVMDLNDAQLGLLVEDHAMSPALAVQLRDVMARKAEAARLTIQLTARRSEIDQIAKDQERVRENMRALKGSAEERQLLQRYVKQLDDQENRIAAVRAEIQTLTAQVDKARADLARAIDAIK